MGHVLCEYGYRVALAHFSAWYPDLEVDSNPFTEKLEDGSMPMETRQKFDDSIPPEETPSDIVNYYLHNNSLDSSAMDVLGHYAIVHRRYRGIKSIRPVYP
ncbi:hypothetical protein BHE74_00008575 [Ensete ventricosum]|nr:hypothetical protein GW17_00033056 [Ensete ventricosum]RWW82938.1 hypothetical protein BHE74_00008575 [Ensete ventricosum]